MKKLLLVFLLIITTKVVKSQIYNFARLGAGASVSSTYPYADLARGNFGYAASVTGYFNISPYLPLGLELQSGQVSGGSNDLDINTRKYKNRYFAAVVHGDVFVGQIFDYAYSDIMHFLKDFYVGTGVGLIRNNIVDVQRVKLNSNPPYTFPGVDHSMNLLVPLRIGYEFKLYNSFGDQNCGINIGYTHNITWGEGLDGYNDPPTRFKNNLPDQYGQIVLGVKFNFGPITSFRKLIDR